ncbi:hypothetical protein Poli38472_008980 [Pythium oligandrum]|uniref:STE/STE11 protein kinase n=1 Tax=Pythium oligandrum TaxID=41045 RepID=A0A8K1FNN7_PYTOL|nr:hypothetical protein Poli38472_008980 [Pythium oligandrum]|eukprot:TMW64813.1 hypothetical protein Poli38472_008980 [Pythium oligandrum]
MTTMPLETELQLSFLSAQTLVWQQGPSIGTGRFGQVFMALCVPTGDFVAVKQIFIQEEYEQGNDTSSLCMQRTLALDKIEREVEIVQSLDHPSIVRFLGAERRGPAYNIFMEYAPAGSMSRLLKELGPFEEDDICRYIQQLTEGVAYLHEQGIAHRDLKCANLLFAPDGSIRIADFGSAKRVAPVDPDEEGMKDEFENPQETARSVREGLGSPYWMAPELVRAERGSDGWCKADVWGIGCVMIELATGRPPWENHSNPLTAMFHIASQDALPVIPPNLSEFARSFLLLCLDKNPHSRPSAAELLSHPFLKHPSVFIEDFDPKVLISAGSRAAMTSSLIGIDAELVTKETSHFPHSKSPPPSPAHSSGSSSVANEAYSSDDEVMVSGVVGSSALIAPVLSSSPQMALGRVRAIADYDSMGPSELSLRGGQELVVVDVNAFGWWRGQVATASAEQTGGWFPSTYVEWLPTSDHVIIKRAHTPAVDSSDELPLQSGDEVLILRCEWREEQLQALGTDRNGRQGWFPFSCVFDVLS